jgi:Ca-activated chloride channel family protein
LLPLPWLIWRLGREGRAEVVDQAQTDQAILLYPHLQQLQTAFSAAPPTLPPSQRLRSALLWLTWLALVGAMMRPQWLVPHTEMKSRGYDLMLAVDVSRSMGALDFTVDGNPVSRMAVIKGVAGRFIEQRKGDRLGLILFGDEAIVQAPLTLDTEVVRSLLDNAEPGMAGNATAIGDAIGLAVKKLRERPAESRVLVLVTDGENTAGSLPPIEAAQLANDNNIRIYAIGVGTKGLVPFPEQGEITMQHMEIDEELLKEVAQITGGDYFRATDTHALEEIYKHINALEKTEAETRSLMVPHPLYRWPLGAAMLALLMLAGLASGGKQREE